MPIVKLCSPSVFVSFRLKLFPRRILRGNKDAPTDSMPACSIVQYLARCQATGVYLLASKPIVGPLDVYCKLGIRNRRWAMRILMTPGLCSNEHCTTGGTFCESCFAAFLLHG